jgi:hypothetical protein
VSRGNPNETFIRGVMLLFANKINLKIRNRRQTPLLKVVVFFKTVSKIYIQP